MRQKLVSSYPRGNAARQVVENHPWGRCLTLDELQRWSSTGIIDATLITHLDQCPICQTLAEKLDSFSPTCAAKRLLELREARRDRLSLVLRAGGVAAALCAVVVLSWGAVGEWRGRAQVMEVAELERARLEQQLAAANARAAELEVQLADNQVALRTLALNMASAKSASEPNVVAVVAKGLTQRKAARPVSISPETTPSIDWTITGENGDKSTGAPLAAESSSPAPVPPPPVARVPDQTRKAAVRTPSPPPEPRYRHP